MDCGLSAICKVDLATQKVAVAFRTVYRGTPSVVHISFIAVTEFSNRNFTRLPNYLSFISLTLPMECPWNTKLPSSLYRGFASSRRPNGSISEPVESIELIFNWKFAYILAAQTIKMIRVSDTTTKSYLCYFIRMFCPVYWILSTNWTFFPLW